MSLRRTLALALLFQLVFLPAEGQAQAESCPVSQGSWSGSVGNASLAVEIVAGGVSEIRVNFGDLCSGPPILLINLFDPPMEIGPDCTLVHSECGPPELGYGVTIEFLDENTASCDLTPTASSQTFPIVCSTCDEIQSFALVRQTVASETTTWTSLKYLYR